MNKLTKLYLTILALFLFPFLFLPMSVTAATTTTATAKTGWWTTPDGKDHVLSPDKIDRIANVARENQTTLHLLKKDAAGGKFKGDKGDKGDRGDNGYNGDKGIRGNDGVDGEAGQRGKQGKRGNDGVDGEAGQRGKQGKRGIKGDKGDDGERGLAGDSFYTDTYGNLDMLSVMAVGDAISNMPAPTSNGFFISSGFSYLGGKSAGAIGAYYVDDIISYKVTYGHSSHERSLGVGIGFRL